VFSRNGRRFIFSSSNLVYIMQCRWVMLLKLHLQEIFQPPAVSGWQRGGMPWEQLHRIGRSGGHFSSLLNKVRILNRAGLDHNLSHLAAISTIFRLGGLPPNQTPIGLGLSGGHPIKISTSGAPLISLGSLGGCPAYKLPTCRQGDPLRALNQ
jgi:hypothetical protein